MSYLKEFQNRILNNDFPSLLQLWAEYCADVAADGEELRSILEELRASPFNDSFGAHVEQALPLCNNLQEPHLYHDVFRLIIDLQTSNSPELAILCKDFLKEKYGEQKWFNEKIRLIGLRSQENFRGAIRNYELLTHLNQGKYVFHTAGWGTGEITDISLIREELVLEFEWVMGRKDLSFANAFKNLVPLDDEHFLARRFGDPDKLEEEAKKSPVEIVRMLLRDLGPKTASEIKEELYELVIPEKDWSKWWQSARSKIKKDTMISCPETIREAFSICSEEISHEARFKKSLEGKTQAAEIIPTIYQFTRDFPEILKNKTFKDELKNQLIDLQASANASEKLQIYLFFDNLLNNEEKQSLGSLSTYIKELDEIEKDILKIDIVAFKKRALVAVREFREDWVELFLGFLLSVQQSVLRDYLLRELNTQEYESQLTERVAHLIECSTLYPEAFVWYFQKAINNDKALPFCDKEGLCRLFESFLILYHFLEQDSKYRDLLKKMHAILSGNRYACVRSILQDTSLAYTKEILLLATKCQTLSDHDIKILQSLAEVVHPSLNNKSKKQSYDNNVIWTTTDGYEKIKERIKEIGTVETVENAKEIEAARALGDLRENSEYKFALEKRNRLQAELKMLSSQLNKARILTKEDINCEEVGVGVVVNVRNSQGKEDNYTILGPWEADPDKNVFSFQSKFAQTIEGCRVGDNFSLKGENYEILGLESFI